MGPDLGSEPPTLVRDVPLAPLTTLELGGAARCLARVASADEVREAVRWARARKLGIAVLGGGSNLVVADAGFDGLILSVALEGVGMVPDGDDVVVAAAAGEDWDALVAATVDAELAGLECLSGIPGAVGATPIQNVGAYGQEVAQVIESVRVLSLTDLAERSLTAADCGFSYRSSAFRRQPGRDLVLEVRFRLRRRGTPTLLYDELRRALAVSAAVPTLAQVRDAVLDLRRAKSMVLDPADPNRRSVGSFFVNPVVELERLQELAAKARAAGALAAGESIPAYAVGGGRAKVPAGWLIERAGFARGLRRGAVGLSSRHALALVHHGGGSTAELLALARDIRDGVGRSFGVRLEPEPSFLGFDTADPLEVVGRARPSRWRS